MLLRRGALLSFKVICQISRSHGLKNRRFESNLSKITRPVAAIKSLRFALFKYKKWLCLSFTGWKFDTTTYSVRVLQSKGDQTFRLRPGTVGLRQEILMHFFSWMVKSFNFLIVAGYPEHWIESGNNQLHVYGNYPSSFECLWNCFHLSYKCYASPGFTIGIWKWVILDLWFKNKFHKHE